MSSSRLALGIFIVLGASLPASLSAHTPESSEVKGLVKRGLGALERLPSGDRAGEKAIVALAFVKSNQADHAIVKNAVRDIHAEKNWGNIDNYSLGLAIILLTEVSEQADAAVLQKLIDELLARQKAHGGWGYDGHGAPSRSEGDISQTQYAVLALWGAKQAGAKFPQEPVEKVCEWLLRVQDPSGAWSYQGVDPGNFQRVPQVRHGNELTHSLTAAGLGSVCVCADLLGLHRGGGQGEEEEETGLPNALRIVKKPNKEREAGLNTRVDRKMVDRAIEDGGRWFAANYAVQVPQWNFYYLYGLERCESFRELYYRKFQKEPNWYNDGVVLLGKLAVDDGWAGDHTGPVSTAFCVLFLQRSSRKAIAKVHKDLGEGVLTSGKGLPTDLANATVKRGKLVDSPLAGEVDDVLAMLEDPENPELSRLLESNEQIKLDADLTKRTGQVTKLRALVTSGNWEARMVAVKALGKARDLDSVPALLYALTDPDPRVVQEADASLRFISRKFDGVGLPAEPDRRAINEARAAWRAWYLSIRPNAELLD